MNRREFLKMASIAALGLFSIGGAKAIRSAFGETTNPNDPLITPVKINGFDRVGQPILKLRYKGELPTEVQANVVTKNLTVLAAGKVIKLHSPEFSNKIKKIQDNIYEISLTLSPELIAGDKILLQIKEKGQDFERLDAVVEVEKQPKNIINNNNIEGYSPKVYYAPGETIELKVHAPQSTFSVDFIRYGKERQLLHTAQHIQGHKQDYPQFPYRNDLKWKTNYSLKIPENWKSGLYAARVYDANHEFYITFIVTNPIDPSIPKHKRIAVLSSTNTWQAYNTWGGASLYQYHLNDDIKPIYAQTVTLQRPNPAATPLDGNEPSRHLANAERLIYEWLEENGYSYYALSDDNLHENPELLKEFGTLIINTHGEYWTKRMVKSLDTFLNTGGNLVTLAGNSVYWKVVKSDHQIEVRKLFGYHTFNGEPGGLWFKLKSSESALLGVRYTPSGYMTFHPYEILQPNHWVFEGTGLKKGDQVGAKGVQHPGASGHETDKRDAFSPPNTILLAKGTNPAEGGAEMVYYDHPGGGGVFSVGSVSFGQSLVVDKHLSQIVNNVLKRFTQDPNAPSNESL